MYKTNIKKADYSFLMMSKFLSQQKHTFQNLKAVDDNLQACYLSKTDTNSVCYLRRI